MYDKEENGRKEENAKIVGDKKKELIKPTGNNWLALKTRQSHIIKKSVTKIVPMIH